jgi:glycosyltransferase involved in cell wall biosynthesis
MGGAPRVAVCSFRLGPNDGVSVVARTWMDTLAQAGFEVVTVTGADAPEGQVEPHRRVDGLGIPDPGATDPPGPDRDALAGALADADLVVVENALTIPLHLPASRALAAELAGRPTLVHHHDPPWERERFAHVTELPADDPAWRHVAITGPLARELAGRCGIDAVVIPNGFAVPGPEAPVVAARRRAATRALLDVADGEALLAHPVRAIARKGVPAAVALAEQVGATYWLLGPAEEGYGPELERILAGARCRVLHRPVAATADIYAAADHVLFPSTWEGFGNPPIEAALHRRTVTVGHYPAADDLRAQGFRWYGPTDAASVRAVLDAPSSSEVRAVVDHNRRLAEERFSLERVAAQLLDLLDGAGWLP